MARGGRRPRRGLVFGLIALAAVIGFLSVFAVWAKRQLLETSTWTDTSTKLLENDNIRTAVSGYLVDTLFNQVDVQAEIETALPPRAAPAAGAITGAVRQLADRLANEALQRPRVQQLWAQANEAAHRTLLDVIQHGGSQDVTLDLGTIVDQLGQQVGVSNVSQKLPGDAGQIVILDNQKLVAAQKAVDLLDTLAWVLTALALLIFALAVYLARGWRREALRTVGFTFAAVGIAVLVARGAAGKVVVNDLATTAAIEPAVQDTWTIATSLLAASAAALIFDGLLIVLGAWLAGPGRAARSARRAITPVLHGRGTAYAALVVLLLLLFWWSPTIAFERLPTSLILIALAVVGMEALRHQAIRDFPGETWEMGKQRWRRTADSLTDRFRGGSDSP